MEITFSAENNGQFVPMHSIFIENLAQGGDTTLYAPGTAFVLDYITSIGNNVISGSNMLSIVQNYPNPFISVTAKQTSQTIKMLNTKSHVTNNKSKIVYTGKKVFESGLKYEHIIDNFVFYLGDEFRSIYMV